MIFNLENFMANFSFCLLFFTMLFYWSFSVFSDNPKIYKVGNIGMIFANLSLLVLLFIRWNNSGHFPLSNLYESLLFLSWSLTFFHIILEKMNQTKNFDKIQFSWIGAITAPSALFTNAFANFSLPVEMQKSTALVPALQSNWLIMHVTIMILSYAALIIGCLLSIAFLIVTRGQDINLTGNSLGNLSIYSTTNEDLTINNNFNTLSTVFKNQKDNDNLFLSSVVDSKDLSINLNYQTKVEDTSQSIYNNNNLTSFYNLAKNLDNLSYRILGFGFPLLTIGILSGSVWANEAWGSYWNWDPKETWALLTWLIFAIYLHTRLTKGWQGKKPAIIASFGFIVVWVCFIGVNLLGKGLHSYGWIRFF